MVTWLYIVAGLLEVAGIVVLLVELRDARSRLDTFADEAPVKGIFPPLWFLASLCF
jgi:hypothetical protein